MDFPLRAATPRTQQQQQAVQSADRGRSLNTVSTSHQILTINKNFLSLFSFFSLNFKVFLKYNFIKLGLTRK